MSQPQTEQTTEVKIFVNRRELELHRHELTGAELLVAAGFDGDAWDLFKLHGEGDPTGGELVQADEVLDLKNGERFRVIPGHRTFGAHRR
jgi:Multiubiquitin